MSCLCNKLQERQYSKITASEVAAPTFAFQRNIELIYSKAEVLNRTWKEAPYLIQVSPPLEPEPAFHTPAKRPTSGTSRARKRPRTPYSSFPNILTRHLPQDQQSEIFPHPTQSFATVTASSLQTTYSDQNAAGILRVNPFEIQQLGIYTKIYLAIQRSDRFQRICYYAFAKLHEKNKSIDPIVKEIQYVLHLPPEYTKQRVYHFLHLGNKWAAIIEQFASIVEGFPQQLTGLLSLLGSASK